MATYLVTGGAGFIGSHIAEELVHRGETVRVLDNLSTGKKENLSGVIGRLDFLEGDVRDIDACRRAVRGADHVLHQAALASVTGSVADPLLTNAINVTGTLNLLLAARDASVRSFVLASSSAAYGDDPGLSKLEGEEGKALSPYGVSKLAGEKYCEAFHVLFGMKAAALRYFNVFGPRQDPRSEYAAVIPVFITKALEGERPVIYGDGEQSRDFIYVKSVVEANILAAESPAAGGETINIASGTSLTVNALLDAVNRITGKGIQAVFEPPRPGDIEYSVADIGKARRVLGFEPRIPFLEALRETVSWYQERS